MAFLVTPVIGANLNAPTQNYIGGGSQGVAAFGPQGAVHQANNGRRYLVGVASTAIPVGTTTCAVTFTPVAGGNGVQSVAIAATGGAFSYAIDLPTGAAGIAAAVGDTIWVGGAQFSVGTAA